MRILFIITTLSLFCITSAFSQVGGIKKGADKNNSSTPTSRRSESSYTGNNGSCSDACTSECMSACFSVMTEYIIMGGIALHTKIIEKKADIPEVISLELMPHFGYASPSSGMIAPRIRGNWGLFSTDIRYSTIMEFKDEGEIDFYKTLDWQVLELNLVVTKPVVLRVGSGFMNEYYSSSVFMEHFIGMDFTTADRKCLFNGEFRIAKDYNTGATPRIEGNLRANYQILQLEHMNGYAMVGAILQNYYNLTNVWTMQAGLTFNIH